MNKRTKLISLAVAALLTVAPTITSTVQADTTTNAVTTTANKTSTNPVITFAGKSYDQDQSINDVTDNASFNYIPVRKVNSMSDTLAAIQKAFTATVSSNDKTPVTAANLTAGSYDVSVFAVIGYTKHGTEDVELTITKQNVTGEVTSAFQLGLGEWIQFDYTYAGRNGEVGPSRLLRIDAAAAATLPSGLSVASITYHLRLISLALGI